MLKQAVKRNRERFPLDFMFEATDEDIDFMVSQSVIPSKQHLGGAKPFLFTEQGVANLSSILTGKIAVEINIKSIKPKQGTFYDGQIFDAYAFVSELIKSAKGTITLFDNYIDESVLTLLSKNQTVKITIYTKNISKQLKLDVEKYNSQYKQVELKNFDLSHDRFFLIDDKVYHIGASLKDLGKKWFAFSKMDKTSFEIMEKLK